MAPQIRPDNKQNGTVVAPKRNVPTMAEFYAGRKILISGVSGFIGKVLMEKTLRSLPDSVHLILLVRSKWGKSAEERVHAFTQTPLFERLKKEKPNAFERVTVIDSDMTQPGLGLTPEARKMIIEEVSVVYHLSALVRLEAPLRPAMEQNVHATRYILDLCLEMKKLDCVVHVSTAFCHPEVETLEERLYPSDIFPKDVDEMLSWMNDDMVAENLPRVLKQHPNCYTFTKRLAELLVGEYVGRLPIVIARPSIVTPSLREPMPGWVDSLNGPVGIVVGAGKGVIRSLICNKEHCAEVIPVDLAANALLITVWHKVLNSKKDELLVYNLTQHDIVQVPWKDVLVKGRKLLDEYPFDGTVWYPDGDMRESRLAHNLIVFFFQTVPAYLLDGILAMVGQKTFLVRLQKRILFGLSLLEYFANRQWSFEIKNGVAVSRQLLPADSKIFPTADAEYDVDEYLKSALLGARQYTMKEPLSTLPKARRQLKILYVIHRVCVAAFYVLVAWMFYRLFQSVTGRFVTWEV